MRAFNCHWCGDTPVAALNARAKCHCEPGQIGQRREPYWLRQMLHDIVSGAPDLWGRQPTGAPTRRFCTQPQEVYADRNGEGVEIETIPLIGLSAFVR